MQAWFGMGEIMGKMGYAVGIAIVLFYLALIPVLAVDMMTKVADAGGVCQIIDDFWGCGN